MYDVFIVTSAAVAQCFYMSLLFSRCFGNNLEEAMMITFHYSSSIELSL